MRISTSMLFTGGVQQIDYLQSQMVQEQEEISTGTSILTPSDNPVAAGEALVVSQTQANNTQYMANGQNAQNSLSIEESTLQGVTTLVQNAQAAVVNAGNGSYTLQQRQAIATSLQGTYNQLLALANSKDGNGNYLFGGYQTTSQPFSPTATGAQYNGNQGQTTLQVGPSQQMAINDSGDTVFQNNVTGNGTFTTSAGATNQGSGVISSGSVTNTTALTGDTYSIAFAGIQTSANAGNTGSATISAGQYTTDGATPTNDTFTISFSNTGGSGSTYNIVNTTTGNTVASNIGYVPGQPLVMGGSQVTISGNPANGDQFTVVDAPSTYTVTDTSTPPSATAAPPVGPQAYVPGQTIEFDGLEFNVTGNPANGDTFNIASSGKQSIFTTLTSLINLLNTPTGPGVAGETNLTNGLNTANNNLSSALNNILTVRASIGARLNEVTSLAGEGQTLNTQYTTTLSGLEDTNDVQAISQYSQLQTTLSAALQTFTQVSKLSLFNYLG